MDCPVCRIPLVVVEREEIELDWCIDCRGLWFDEGELMLLGEKADRELEAEDLGRGSGTVVGRGERRCPRCRRRMQQVDLPGGPEGPVRVDRCDDHGIWLDRGELGRILRRRAPEGATDEGLMLNFLGETFAARVAKPADPPPSERRSS